jgi:ATP-dependent RNA helicase RhlE
LTKFSELGLSKPTVNALEQCGYIQPTEIQEQTIPLIMAGSDVMASAQTGSGKTAAYALPLIECLDEPEKKPRVLVLVPTRELALQVEEQFTKFAKFSELRSVTLYGGTGYDTQTKALKRGVDIIVATPGRLYDLMERRSADLSNIEILVLDEADRLLDMGFMPQVRRIVSKLSKERQTLMFSATIDERVERIAAEHLNDPVTVRVNSDHIEPSEIDQRMYNVTEFGKDALLLQLITELNMTSVIVFTKTRRRAGWVRGRLHDAGVLAEEIHGDITQSQREKTLNKYRKGQFPVLVATDVAARGLDIPAITHVVNYDLPESPEDYVHRIGRTGRAGRSGIALSFVCEDQSYLVRDIEKLVGRSLEPAGTQAQVKKPSLAARRFRSGGRRRIV